MKIAPSGIPLHFEYTFYDGLSGRFVGMTVIDTTAGLPGTVVNPTPIAMVHCFGGTFAGEFTPDPNKKYLIHKKVYTDNTYSVEDTNFSPGSEAFTTAYGGLLDAIWNFDVSAVVGPVAAGFVLYTIPMAQTVAAAVWNALRASFNAAGSFGELFNLLTPQRIANLDNLDQAVSSISTSMNLSEVEFVVGSVEEEEEIIGIVEDL